MASAALSVANGSLQVQCKTNTGTVTVVGFIHVDVYVHVITYVVLNCVRV